MPMFDAILEAVQLMSYGMLLLIIAPLFPFLYVVMRWRAPGTGHTGIGTLGAIHYFIVMSALLLLAGSANLCYGWVSITPVNPEMTRISWGTLSGSLAFLVINLVLLRFTRDLSDVPDVRRMFIGFFLVIAGLTAFGALLLLCVSYFSEVKDGDAEAGILRHDAMKLYGFWVIYFLGGYLASTWWLTRTAPDSSGAR